MGPFRIETKDFARIAMAYRPLPPSKTDDPVDGAQHVARIDALTRNARSTWFALLSGLLFVGITLMNVEHIDFYGVDRATQLPLINVQVPTRLFFLAAPILIAAIYGYFHLYLIRLWEALGKAPAHINGTPLGDAIAPWLVTDAALYRRRLKRGDGCAESRAMERESMFLNFLLSWGFGPLILGLLWWESMTARSLVMSGIAGVALLVSISAGYISLVVMLRRMRGVSSTVPIAPSRRTLSFAIGVLLIGIVAVVTSERTWQMFNLVVPARALESSVREAFQLASETTNASQPTPEPPMVEAPLIVEELPGNYSQAAGFDTPADLWATTILDLAPIDLNGQSVVEKPKEWLPNQFAKQDFRASWCRREGHQECHVLNEEQANRFDSEWRKRRTAEVSALRKPGFNAISRARYDRSGAQAMTFRRRPPNLRGADLRQAFLAGANLNLADLRGADLSEAQMEGAVLNEAQMEGAFLFAAQIQGANFSRAQMEGAELIGAQMQGANLSFAQMQGAILGEAQMEGAVLRGAQMEGAILEGARMEGADLSLAQMEGANLSFAQMEGANLSFAQMEGAVLRGAQMEGADLSYSWIAGRADLDSVLEATNLSASTNNGGALRFVDLRPAILDGTDFRNAFLDGSVEVPEEFRAAMGNPCQWINSELSDMLFFGLWRAWDARDPDGAGWDQIAPEARRDVQLDPETIARYLPDDCKWKTGPMPGTETAE